MSIKKALKVLSQSCGGSGDGRTIADLILEIAATKNPLVGMTIDFDIADSVDLFGKKASDLQSLSLKGDHVVGSLNKIEGYTGFSNKQEEQSGHYMAIHCSVPEVEGATIKFVNRFGVKQAVDPSDGIIVLIVNKPGIQRMKFEVSKEGYPTVVKEFIASEVYFE